MHTTTLVIAKCSAFIARSVELDESTGAKKLGCTPQWAQEGRKNEAQEELQCAGKFYS